jgi:hypothetical protein
MPLVKLSQAHQWTPQAFGTAADAPLSRTVDRSTVVAAEACKFASKFKSGKFRQFGSRNFAESEAATRGTLRQ